MGQSEQTHEKLARYSSALIEKLHQVFTENDNALFLELQENEDNATLMLHAIANVAPTFMHNTMTASNMSQLDFNHVANTLCFQYSTLVVEQPQTQTADANKEG